MTRNDLIKRAAALERSVSQERAFIRGAAFADEHVWVSVADANPETDGNYLTSDENGYRNINAYSEGQWYDDDDRPISTIAFWMPIPEPPTKTESR